MKVIGSFLILLLLSNTPVFAIDQKRDTYSIPGFECRQEVLRGFRCTGTIKNYPSKIALPVVFFIPSTFNPKKKVEVILHLHGHLFVRDVDGNGKKRMETFRDVLKKFNFGKKLEQIGRNAILVLPSSRGRNRTYNKVFVKQHRFPEFIRSVEKVLGDGSLLNGSKIRHLVLSGHSGAYYSLCEIIKEKEVKEVIRELYLFDALYGCRDGFAEFAKKKTFKSAFSVFTKKTTYQNKRLWKTLRQYKGKRFNRKMRYSKTPISRAAIKKYDILMVGTKKGHWAVVNEFFTKFLRVN